VIHAPYAAAGAVIPPDDIPNPQGKGWLGRQRPILSKTAGGAQTP